MRKQSFNVVNICAVIADRAGCQLLYSLKPLTFVEVLGLIAPYVDGFSVSSLFEAALARTVSEGDKTVHLTTPGLRPNEMGKLAELCDYISFNSISQWQRHKNELGGRGKLRSQDQPSAVLCIGPQIRPLPAALQSWEYRSRR